MSGGGRALDVGALAVRRAGREDVDRLRTLRLAALRDAPGEFSSTLAREQARTPAGWRSWVDTSAVFLGERGGETCGLVCGVPHEQDARRAFLMSLWVRPDARGAGLADLLVLAVIDWAAARGLDELLLDVVEDNVRARAVYTRQGFEARAAAPRAHDGVLERRFAHRLRGATGGGRDLGLVTSVARNPVHALGKLPVEAVRLVAGHGVEGDCHAGSTVQHRSRVARDPTQPNLRQVHLIHAELHDTLRTEGFDVAAGVLGENVTTRGVDLLSLPWDSLLHAGPEAVVQVTGLRNPCAQLDGLAPGLMAASLVDGPDGRRVGRAGILGVVRVGGRVRVGDALWVERPARPWRHLERV